MTIDRKTVTRLAKEAGMAAPREIGVNDLWGADDADLMRFAALVLEHGRKPLTEREIDDLITRADVQRHPAFAVGVRWAIRRCEAAHGITSKESSDAE